MSAAVRRAVVVSVAVAGVAASVGLAPRALRRLDTFRVRRVEVVGSRFAAPYEVVEASGITRASNVFDDTDVWRRTLLRHPMVADVRVERRLPGTIVLRVVEVEPIALVRTPELRMVDPAGRVLPVEAAGFDVDLPVIAIPSSIDADGRLGDATAAALVDALARVRRLEPGIAARVSEVLPQPDGGVRMVLTAPDDADVVLPGGVSRPRLRALRLTLANLARRGELARVRRVDLRFRDQVVVSLTPISAS